MLLFRCPDCEAFSIGKPQDYLTFLENHMGAFCETYSYEALKAYMNDSLRLHKYFEQVGNFSKDDLTPLLIDTFSVERDRLLAENAKKEKHKGKEK